METPDRETLESMSAADLRRLCRERGITGAWTATARKGDMIDLLASGGTQAPDVPQPATATVDGLTALLADVASRAVDDRLESLGIDELLRPLVIRVADRPDVQFGPQETPHAALAEMLEAYEEGVENLMLVGPAGTGKTTLARDFARALARPFAFLSLSEGVSESAIWGRTLPDAQGVWRFLPAAFYRTYTTGGVFLLDEFDSADSNLLTSINAALANGALANPFDPESEPVTRHPDCLIVCACNTYGTGSDRVYVGRNALDGATLDRFVLAQLWIDYDERLEQRLAESVLTQAQADELRSWIRRLRERIAEYQLRRIASTRLVKRAAVKMSRGASIEQIETTYLRSWSPDERAKVRAA